MVTSGLSVEVSWFCRVRRKIGSQIVPAELGFKTTDQTRQRSTADQLSFLMSLACFVAAS